MFRKFFRWYFGTSTQPTQRKANGWFSLSNKLFRRKREESRALITIPVFKPVEPNFAGFDNGMVAGMDGGDGSPTVKQSVNPIGDIGESTVAWFLSQNFIGYQLCALLMQHWLVDKACSMPGRDAVRNGWEITVNDGVMLPTPVLDFMRQKDKDYKIKKQLKEFIRFGRGFGIRVAIFVVDSTDPDYYSKPFNIDGIVPGSYKGISQVDPYWMVPLLTNTNTRDPSDPRFYEPTFWQIGTKTYHFSHLSIFTTGAVADVLKPGYYYGGVSVPQRIYERIYAAERTANEAPMLAMTKRLTTINTDVAAAVENPAEFELKMKTWADFRDNFGVKIAGEDEKIDQFETSLSDMDNLIMTQYQLVAAIAEVPGTKLLGTQPKGFNSTGEYEEASYHESLESLQENDMTPMLERHHQLVIKSDVLPKFPDVQPFTVTAVWQPLDAMTALEQAQLNLLKAQADTTYVAAGAIDGQDIRKRIINDPQSGYNGLPAVPPALPPEALGPAKAAHGAAPAGQGGAADPDASAGSVGETLPHPPRPTVPHIAATPGA